MSKCFLIAILFSCSLGCDNGDLVRVSGTITFEGEPVEEVLVVFAPKAKGDDHFPGPISTGITDKQGKYHLKTKNGSSGAVAGVHSVGFNWSDISSLEIALLNEEYSVAMASGASDKILAEIQSRIDDTARLAANRPADISSVNRTYEVPTSGTESANFELSGNSN